MDVMGERLQSRLPHLYSLCPFIIDGDCWGFPQSPSFFHGAYLTIGDEFKSKQKSRARSKRFERGPRLLSVYHVRGSLSAAFTSQ